MKGFRLPGLAAIVLSSVAATGSETEANYDADDIVEPGKGPFFSRLPSPLRLRERIEAMPPGRKKPFDIENSHRYMASAYYRF